MDPALNQLRICWKRASTHTISFNQTSTMIALFSRCYENTKKEYFQLFGYFQVTICTQLCILFMYKAQTLIIHIKANKTALAQSVHQYIDSFLYTPVPVFIIVGSNLWPTILLWHPHFSEFLTRFLICTLDTNTCEAGAIPLKTLYSLSQIYAFPCVLHFFP